MIIAYAFYSKKYAHYTVDSNAYFVPNFLGQSIITLNHDIDVGGEKKSNGHDLRAFLWCITFVRLWIERGRHSFWFPTHFSFKHEAS